MPEVYGVLIGLSQVIVVVHGCLEDSPQIQQVWGQFLPTRYWIHSGILCTKDFETILSTDLLSQWV